MDQERISENERLQIEHIRQLDAEELEIEEVDEDFHPSAEDDDEYPSSRGDGGAGPYGGFIFNTSMASLHTYLGEVADTRGRPIFLDGGAILNLPMFYLEGVVLFPGATLPLRVVQSKFKAAVERALTQADADAPYTIGVVRVHRNPNDGRICFPATGTTAEIRKYRRLDDGSLNVVTRGQQRFRLRRCWVDVDWAPFAEVQIVQEDTPLRTPKAAFGQLASVSKFRKCSFPRAVSSGLSPDKRHGYEDAENNLEGMSVASTGTDHSETGLHLSATESPSGYERNHESSSSDEELVHGMRQTNRSGRSCRFYNHGKRSEANRIRWDSLDSSPERKSSDDENLEAGWVVDGSKCIYGAPMSFWPHWVYQMYDAYSLARRATDLWRHILGTPSLDDYIKKPDLLSFYIASKLPMSESTRQELLEMDGISYRLQKEIELLKCFNLVRCKHCQSLIAKRSDMVVMSSDGPLNAYVNPYGYVHEIITVFNATGLALQGPPVKEHSWFPGYAWTIANCSVCESNMGWLFTATKKNLLPSSFWGIRNSQVATATE